MSTNRLKQAIAAAALGPPVSTGGDLVQEFRFGAAFPGFAGHFPGHPVLPAIVQILCAQHLIEHRSGRALHLRSLDRAKFLRQVRPGEVLRVSCRPREGSWEARLEVQSEATAAFSMTLVEEEAE